MNYAKKMILVDPKVVEQIQHVKETKPKTLNLLDVEMQAILENKTLPDNEKKVMYKQVLQNYLNIVNNNRQPLEIPITVKQQLHTSQQMQQQQQTPQSNQASQVVHNVARLLLQDGGRYRSTKIRVWIKYR